MSKPSELACICAALFLLHTGSGRAAVPVEPGVAHPSARLIDGASAVFSGVFVAPVSHPGRLSNARPSFSDVGAACMAYSGAARVPVLQDVNPGAPSAHRNASHIGDAMNEPRRYQCRPSAHEFQRGPGVDFLLPRIARPPQLAVPGYHELDASIAWQALPGVEPALTGRNLLHARHPAPGAVGLRQPAERAVFAAAAPRF
jgi:hypothetical protein